MKNRIVAVILIVFISIPIFGCSTNSDITDKNLIYNSTALTLPKDIQAETTAEEIKNELNKTLDEKHNRYNFTYKRSVLSIRKEIFEEYNLTDEHIQKFFDGAETAYDKLAGFFPEYDVPEESGYEIPEVFTYNALPKEFSEFDLYEDYGDIFSAQHPVFNGLIGGWISTELNAIFYEENILAKCLAIIDTGFPYTICHELGHLFTFSPDIYKFGEEPVRTHIEEPYVWDSELFAELSAYYLASEFTVANYSGAIVTVYNQGEDFYWNKFFGLVEKYGYNILSETFKGMMTGGAHDIDEVKFDLFKQVLSQKTGDDINRYYTSDNPVTIQGKEYDPALTSLRLSGELADSDIEALKDMVNLTILYLIDSPISDAGVLFSALAELPNLTSLLMSNNQINDFSALSEMMNLNYLLLANSQINDIRVLTELKNLRSLGLNYNQISDISLLAEMTDLTDLYISNNQIKDISVLEGLTNLSSLSLAENQISEISALTGLTNLQYLNLQGNPINPEQIAKLREALPNAEIISD